MSSGHTTTWKGGGEGGDDRVGVTDDITHISRIIKLGKDTLEETNSLVVDALAGRSIFNF